MQRGVLELCGADGETVPHVPPPGPVRGGVHLTVPVESRPSVRALAPEALQAQYRGWGVDRGARRGAHRWFFATKP